MISETKGKSGWQGSKPRCQSNTSKRVEAEQKQKRKAGTKHVGHKQQTELSEKMGTYIHRGTVGGGGQVGHMRADWAITEAGNLSGYGEQRGDKRQRMLQGPLSSSVALLW